MGKSCFIISLCILLWFGIGSCKNSCKHINCLNGGRCTDGVCNCDYRYGGKYCDSVCPAGYEGEYCNIVIRNKFLRRWSAVTRASNGAGVDHFIELSAGTATSYINIWNLTNDSSYVLAIVSGDHTFDIYPQHGTGTDTSGLSGSGDLNDTKLTIYLTKGTIDYISICNP